jgi:hypothetical protein
MSMLNAIMLNVIIFNAIMLNLIVLSVVMHSVMILQTHYVVKPCHPDSLLSLYVYTTISIPYL